MHCLYSYMCRSAGIKGVIKVLKDLKANSMGSNQPAV